MRRARNRVAFALREALDAIDDGLARLHVVNRRNACC